MKAKTKAQRKKNILRGQNRQILYGAGLVIVILAILAGTLYSFPDLLTWRMKWERTHTSRPNDPFPVTVNPSKKIIVENPAVDAYLEDVHSLFEAGAGNTQNVFWNFVSWAGVTVSEAPWYQGLATADATRFVTIQPGLRKEQVASVFGKALGWTKADEKAFLTPAKNAVLPLQEGSFMPGIYSVSLGMKPAEVQSLVNERFSREVLAHYRSSVSSVIPLQETLTIASLIQRETIGTDGMRLISGIMWNRLFAGMNLQIDATLQYARASRDALGVWWPTVHPKDKYIASPYNTYLNEGLPPGPIATPSVAAILAALNPVKTDCLFYFNDASGKFHCSGTYKEHAKLLNAYY